MNVGAAKTGTREVSILSGREQLAPKGCRMKLRMLYVDGRPFHLAGTKVYREADGTLSFECPHCGRRAVPRRYEKSLGRYARKR